ncbi:MAG TPA: PEP-CTERM sorting domain-containing protein [Terriglobales bacterium]|nr:PEP-CTERM sorting domain-containing protein [Terriglobales bacterium]
MRKLLILVVLVGAAVYAYAGATNSGFDPTTNSGPVEFTFLGWNNGNWQNGYPYEIQPTNGPAGSVIAVMCDDYMHGGQPGQEWMANITDLGTGNITLTRFNLTVGPYSLYPLFLYEEAGWILKQTQVEPTSQWMPMNYAVWNIFDPNSPCNSACQTWLAAAFIGAKEEPLSYYDNVYIVTPVNQYNPDPNSMQEFMFIGSDPSGQGASSTVPEPGTLLLLGSGLLAVLRRKIFN